jgi:hypothetical protein
MVMRIEPKDDIELAIWDEIETLNENIEIVASLLKDQNIPFLAARNAEELLEMLIKIKTMFENEEVELEKKVAILEKLPLLYLQINFIKQQIKSGIST